MTTAVIVLAAVLVAVVGFHGWSVREWSRERARLLAAIVAETPRQAQLSLVPPPVKAQPRSDDRPEPVLAVGDDG